jgi:hypothetical protein
MQRGVVLTSVMSSITQSTHASPLIQTQGVTLLQHNPPFSLQNHMQVHAAKPPLLSRKVKNNAPTHNPILTAHTMCRISSAITNPLARLQLHSDLLGVLASNAMET